MKRAELTPDDLLKRSRMEIIAEILETHRKPVAKPGIMPEARMPNPNFHVFVNQLLRSRLLEFSDDIKEFITTEKGVEFVKNFNALQELLK